MRNIFLIGLAIVVVAAISATAGFFYGNSVGKTQANQIRQDFLRQRSAQGDQSGMGFPGSSGQGGVAPLGQGGPVGRPGQPGTMGTVKSIEGNTMDISTRDSVVKVTLTEKTTVQKQAAGSLSDIKVGESVMVIGNQESGGTITARSVQLVPGAPQPSSTPSSY